MRGFGKTDEHHFPDVGTAEGSCFPVVEPAGGVGDGYPGVLGCSFEAWWLKNRADGRRKPVTVVLAFSSWSLLAGLEFQAWRRDSVLTETNRSIYDCILYFF